MYNVSISAVEEACLSAGLDPERAIRADYSGRFMFGKECLGIVYDSTGELMEFGAALMAEDPKTRKWLKDSREDEMGLSRIVYWPTVQVENNE